MKKYVVLIPALLLVALPVYAADFVGNNTSGYSVPAGETRTKDIYVGAKQIDIAGAVNADANLAGQTILVGGTVEQDLIAAGQTMTVSGSVGHNIRAAGQSLTVSGKVHGDIIFFGESLTVAPGATVDGDILFFGQTLTISGQAMGEVHAWGQDVAVTGGKTGSITAHAVAVTLTNAQIAGDVTYYSDKELAKDAATTIAGAVTRVPLPAPMPSKEEPFAAIGWGGLLMMLVMAALTVWLFKDAAHGLVDQAIARPVRSVFVGIAVLVAIPVASIILLITIIGLPLGFLMLFLYGALIIVAKVLTGILAGAVIAKMITKEYQVTYVWAFVGVVALALIKFVPVIGWIPGLLAFFALLGVVFSALEHKLFRSESVQ